MSSFYPLENSVERLVPRSSETSTPDYGICKTSNRISYSDDRIYIFSSLGNHTFDSETRQNFSLNSPAQHPDLKEDMLSNESPVEASLSNFILR